jgi:hypothetical protein
MKDQLGLVATPAQRTVRVLVVKHGAGTGGTPTR